MYGNRGCLHDASGRIVRRYQVRRWIACRLEFKDRRRRPLMRPGRFTELFFLDEATALAAGHRPCAECRREDFVQFAAHWAERHPGEARADAIDLRLHAERIDREGARRLYELPVASLPDGAFVLRDGEPYAVVGPSLRLWTPRGYTANAPRPTRGMATVVTPPSLVKHLRVARESAVPMLHTSAS